MTSAFNPALPAIEPVAHNYTADRVILSSRQLEALSVLLDIEIPLIKREILRDMECVEDHNFGDFRIDLHYRRVIRGELPVHLTPREYELLLALARRDGAAVSADDLIREVWRGNIEQGSRTLSQHVFALRKKLERDPSNPRFIITVSKFGYRLEGGMRTVRTRNPNSSNR